jgi:hypothetical protein
MKTRIRLLICVSAALSVLLLSGCQAAATPPPADTPTELPTITPTTIPTKTHTPTDTPTATVTLTITPTYTETPAYNVPGKYPINRCQDGVPSGPLVLASSITICLTTVEVLEDYSMKFNVQWHIIIDWWNHGTKYSDEKNTNIYLTDDLGNYYPHFAVGGCAALTITHQYAADEKCNGWFLFPPAKPGAKSFNYFDLNNSVSFDKIVLLQKTGTDTPTFTPTPPTGTPYNAPGTYYIYRCASYQLGGTNPVQICLNTVVVNSDSTMKFNLSWKPLNGVPARKPSVANNHSIFLLDDLKNEYHYLSAGGCAEVVRGFQTTGESCGGWFLFPAAQPGATSFRFVDLGNLISFDNIVLLPKN